MNPINPEIPKDIDKPISDLDSISNMSIPDMKRYINSSLFSKWNDFVSIQNNFFYNFNLVKEYINTLKNNIKETEDKQTQAEIEWDWGNYCILNIELSQLKSKEWRYIEFCVLLVEMYFDILIDYGIDNLNALFSEKDDDSLNTLFEDYSSILSFIKSHYDSKKSTNNTLLNQIKDWVFSADTSKIKSLKEWINKDSEDIDNNIKLISDYELLISLLYFKNISDLWFIKKLSIIISNSQKKFSQWFNCDMEILEKYRYKLRQLNNTYSTASDEMKSTINTIIWNDWVEYNKIFYKLEFIIQLFRYVLIFKQWAANISSSFNKDYLDEYFKEFEENKDIYSQETIQAIYNLFWTLYNQILDQQSANTCYNKWIEEEPEDSKMNFANTISRNQLYYNTVRLISDLQFLLAKIRNPNLFNYDSEGLTNEIFNFQEEILSHLKKIENENVLLSWVISWNSYLLSERLSEEIVELFNDRKTNWFVWRVLEELDKHEWKIDSLSESKMIFTSLITILYYYLIQTYNEIIDNSKLKADKYDIDYDYLNFLFDKKTIELISSKGTLETDYLVKLYNTVINEKDKWSNDVLEFEKLFSLNWNQESEDKIISKLIRSIPNTHTWWVEFFSFIKMEKYFKQIWKIKFNHIIRLIFGIIDNFDLQYSPWHSRRVAKNAEYISNILLSSEEFCNKYNWEIEFVQREMLNILNSKYYEWIDEIVSVDTNDDNYDLFWKCLYLACLVHDAWKVSINLLTLSSRIPPTDEEYLELTLHSKKWRDVLQKFMWERVSIPQFLIDWTLHHERPDGRGYPYKLTWDEMSLVSKIVAIADSIDAMLWKRSYIFETKSIDYVLSELEHHSWEQFDTDIVSLLINNEVFRNYLLDAYNRK